MAFCAQCGHQVDGSFCGNCGAPTTNGTAPSQDETVVSRINDAPTGSWQADAGAEDTAWQQRATDRPAYDWEPQPTTSALPASRSHRTRWLIGGLASVVAVAVILVGALLLRPKIFGDNSSDAQAAQQPASADVNAAAPGTTSIGPSAQSDTTTTESPDSPTPSSTSTDPEQAAEHDLTALYDGDISSFAADGQWMAQLSSKCDGITDPNDTTADGRHTFHDQDILAQTRELHSRFADVQLVKSTDFGTQLAVPCHGTDKTLWTTVYNPGTFSSKADVTAWCDENFSDKTPINNFCLPRQATAPHD